MDVYFPSTYVNQTDLEAFDGVSAGKYTIGLGQSNMAVCGEEEDINSVCLSAVHSLLEKYNIPPSAIGRLEIGTETMVDKSKAVKTALMDLFGKHGNFDIEGIDSKNACYGGTAAVLNSLAWVESSAWDGRYAIAVAGDIAVYEPGPARPTGGAGVVAMLIGPNAPLAIEPGARATHMENAWDFYKPTMVSEYPRVDGHLSNACYLRALDGCYSRFADKYEKKHGAPWLLSQADYAVFHAPYNKLVQRSFGRYLLQDFKRHPSLVPHLAGLAQFAALTAEETYTSKPLQEALRELSKAEYARKVAPSELITKECGNSYCGSLYAGLLSLISNQADSLLGKRIMMFSYGSGLASTLFSVKARGDVRFIRDAAAVPARLAQRQRVSPQEFSSMLEARRSAYTRFDYSPKANLGALNKGTYYLTKVDNYERRFYARAFSTAARLLR